jgi:hypothetical protein
LILLHFPFAILLGILRLKINDNAAIYDDLVKSLKTVTPAEAGVQNSLNLLDSRFRGNDKNGEVATFYETIIYKCESF